MNALLLAAGYGTRLRPLTVSIPKCMVPIHGVPLIEIWLSRIFSTDIQHAVVNLHYLPGPVKELVQQSRWSDRVTLLEEPELLGTGGTLRAARDILGDEPCLVIHADNLSTIDIDGFRAAHAARPEDCAMTMALFETDDPQNCGIVERDDQKRVIAMHEKLDNPPGNLANAAVYIFEPEVQALLRDMPDRVIDLSTQVIPALMGRIYSYKIAGYHRDIGTPTSLERAQQDFLPKDILALCGRTTGSSRI